MSLSRRDGTLHLEYGHLVAFVPSTRGFPVSIIYAHVMCVLGRKTRVSLMTLYVDFNRSVIEEEGTG